MKKALHFFAARVAAAIFILMFSCQFVDGQTTRYWSGQGSSDNMNDGNNWWSGTPNSGDNLYFNNTAGGHHYCYSNYGSGSYFSYIIEYNGSGIFEYYGNTTYVYGIETDNTSTSDPMQFNTTIENRTSPNTALTINLFGASGIDFLAGSGNGIVMQNAQNILVYGTNTLTVSSVISESGTAGSGLVLEGGSGNSPTVILGAANTYTGTTTVNAGTLQIAATNAIPSGSNVVLNGGTLSSGASTSSAGFADAMGTLQLSASTALTLGTGSYALKFTGATSWTAGQTLAITGWSGTAGTSNSGGNQIFIGTSNTLSSAQLAEITVNGGAAWQLCTGEIVKAGTAPTVSVAANPSGAVCIGTSVTYTATPSNGGASPNYNFKVNGTSVQNSTTATYSYAPANGNVITCVMTNNTNCQVSAASNSITMTVNALVTPSVSIVSGSGTSVCAGTSVTYTATPTNGGASPTYNFKVNGASVQNTTAATYSYSPANNDAITCVMTSNATCPSPSTATSGTVTMTVTPTVTPSVSIASGSGTTVCAGTSVTYTATPTNGGSAPTYNFKVNGTSVQNTTAATYSYAPANNDVITCVMTSNATCPSPATATSSGITMTVNAVNSTSVSVASGSGTTVCTGTSVTFTATPANGGSAPTYNFEVNGSSVQNGTGNTYTYTPANNDAVKCLMTSNATCPSPATATSSTVTMTVTGNVTPSVSIASGSGTTVCGGTSVTYTATPTYGGSAPVYNFKVNGTSVQNSTTATYSYTPANGDVITCVMTSNYTCLTTTTATSNSVTMTVNPILTTAVSIASGSGTSVCAGTSVTYTATPTNGGSAPTYNFKVNGTSQQNTSSATYTYTPVNNDVVTCVMTSNATCPSSTTATSNTVTMTVTATVTPSVSISTSATTICSGTSLTFTAAPTNGGSAPTYNFEVNGTSVQNNSTATYSYTPANGDVVKCIMTTNATCPSATTATSNSLTITVNANVTPAVSISSGSGTSVCASTSVTYTATPTNGGSAPTYNFKVNGTSVQNTTTATYTYNPANGDVITCVMTSNATCPSPTTGTSNSITMSVTSAPTITGVAAATALAGQSASNSGYYGQAINITGTNFSASTTVTINGAAASVTYNSSTSLTAVVGASATMGSGNVKVTNSPCAVVTYGSAFTVLGYITTATGDWTTTGTWLGGVVPPAGATTFVNNTVGISTAISNAPAGITISSSGSLTFNSASSAITSAAVTNNGTLAWTAAGTLTIAASGTLTNNSTFTAGTGTVNFSGAGTLTGTIAFNNLMLNGALTDPTTVTVNGNLQLNTTSSTLTHSVTYGPLSTLTYNSGSTFPLANEWTGNGTSAGSGIPQNVTIQNSTTLNMPTTNRGLAGDINITSGNLTLNGTSGDIYVGGNWTRASGATFTPSNRAVFFDGSGTQVISVTGGGTETFNYFLTKNAGNVQLSSSPATSVTISSYSGLSLNSSASLDLNGQAMYVTGGGNLSIQNATGTTVITSSSGTGNIWLENNNLTIASSGASLKFDNNVNVQISSAAVNFGSGVSTIGGGTNGTLIMNNGATISANPPAYANGSTLKYNSGGLFNRGYEWSTASSSGYPFSVEVATNTTLSPGATGGTTGTVLDLAGNLNLDAGGSLYMDYNGNNMTVPLIVAGNLVLNGNLSETNSSVTGGDIQVAGSWTFNTGANYYNNNHKVTLNGAAAQTIGGTQGTTFYNLTIANTSGGVTISKPTAVSNVLTLTSGIVTTTTSNTLTLQNTGTGAVSGGSTTAFVNGPLNWTLPSGLSSSASVYSFPVGAGTTYLPMSITTVSTGSTGPVLQAQAFSASCGGTAGTGLASLSTTEYWEASVISGNYTSASVSVTRQTAVTASSSLGESSTVNGTYNFIGGSPNTGTNSVNNSNATGAGFYVISVSSAPTITSIVPTSPAISGQGNNTGYIGQTITVNGTNFESNSTATVGGVASTVTYVSSTQLTMVVPAAAASTNVTVTNPSSGLSNSGSFTNLGYITTATGDWNTGATWLGGGVPPASATTTVNNAITVNGTVSNAPASVTINSGDGITMGSSGILNIAASGILTNNGTFTGGSGTLNYAGAGTLNGSTSASIGNLTINTGTITLTTVPTINGTFTINGGSISAAPKYGSSSTLLYNVSYSRYNEWSASGVGTIGTTAGYPNNVHVSNNSTLDVANGVAGTERAMAGSLTIDMGSTVSLNVTAMTQPLVVGANINLAGTLTLSTSSGGDIKLGGNWSFTVGGTFTPNARAVFFTGNTLQTITRSAAGTLNFDYLINSNTSGGIQLASSPATSVNVNAPNGGNGLSWLSSTTNFDLNGNSIYLTANQSIGLAGADNIISSSGTGYVTVNTGTVSSVSGSGTLAFSSAVTVSLYGGFDFGSDLSTIKGTLLINAGGYVNNNAPNYASGSLLQYYSATTPYTRGLEWSTGTGPGYPYNVQVSNNTTIDAAGTAYTGTTFKVANNLTIDAGSSIYMDYSSHNMTIPLNIAGNLVLNGNISESGVAGGDINISGNWTNNGTANNFFPNGRTVSFVGSAAQTISGTNSSGFGFAYLTINNSAGVTLSKPATVANTLTMTSGLLNTSTGSTLTITNTATSGVSGGSTSCFVNGPLNWTLPASLSSNSSTYDFPVGAGSTYLPFSITNVTTGSTGPVLEVQAFTGNCGGSAGAGLASISTTEYWDATVVSGNYTSASVSLTRQSTVGSLAVIGESSTKTGSYAYEGGTGSGDAVNNSNTVGAGYYVISTSVGAPTITSVVPTSPAVSGQANNTGYVGQTLTINGTNFPNNATVTIGGVSASTTYLSGTQLTAVVAAGSTGTSIVVTNPTTSATATAPFTNLGYITVANSDWNTGSTWLGGSVPPVGATTTVNSNATVNATVSNSPATVTVNSGSKLTFGSSGVLPISSSLTFAGTVDMTSGGTINFNGNCTFTNNGTFTYGTGSVNFTGNNGTSTVNGSNATSFYDVEISGPTSGINLGGSPTPNSTIIHSFTIGSGSYFVTNAPYYATNSTLIYNVNGSYNRNVEWSQLSGPAYPYNVEVANGTTLNMSFGTGLSDNVARAIAGTLTIDNGASVTMNSMTTTMTTGGLVLNSGGTLTLSSAIGGDYIINGNWTNNGSFVPNSRAVQFSGSSAQTITGATAFDYLTIDNSNGVSLNSNITVSTTLTFTTGNLILGTNNITLSSGAVIAGAGASGYVKTNSTGQMKETVGNSAVYFTVGNAAYNPIVLTNSGTSDIYGINVIDGSFTANNNTKVVNERWQITEAVSGGSNLAVKLQWNTNEDAANFAAGTNDYIGFYNSSAWNENPATQAGSNPYTFTSTANFTPANLTTGTQYFAIGKDNAFECTTIVAPVISSTNVTCNGAANGTVTVSTLPTGGLSPYTYSLNSGSYQSSTSFAALTPNTYSVIAQDNNGCTSPASNSVTITQPAALTAAISGGTSPVCYNASPGTFTATGSGGSGVYTYQWYNTAGSISGQTNSTYATGNLTADDSYHCSVTSGTCGTVATGIASITVYPNLTAVISGGTSPLCYNSAPGTFRATAGGGTGSYTYQWYNGAGLINGETASSYAPGNLTSSNTYYCAISSGSCAAVNTATTSITVYPVLGATISGGTSPVCYDAAPGTYSAAASGGSGTYTYQWYNGAGLINGQTASTFAPGNLTSSNTYYCEVSSSTCTNVNTSTRSVTVLAQIGATASNGGPYLIGQTIGLTSGPASETGYSWSGPSFTASVQNPAISNATTAMGGVYTVTVTGAGNCTATATTTVVVTTTATYTWTGNVSTDWTIPNNWNPVAPVGGPNDINADIIIPSVNTKPILATPVSVGNVQIDANGQITLNANINVYKDWVGGPGGNAYIIGTGIIVFNGTSAQTISGKTQMQEVAISNGSGVSMQSGSSLDVFTALDLQTGNFDATNGTLTFKSTSVTAIGIINNFSSGYAGTLTGSINAERYYASSSTYNQHYIGSPVNSPSFSQFGASGTPGYVTPTGNCDETQLANNSVYGTVFSLQESHGSTCALAQWEVVTTGNAVNGMGYSVLKQGAGALTLSGTANLNASYTVNNLTNSNWSNTTLQNRHTKSGWQLLSNPYLATLQITTNNTGIDNQVQVWNANGSFAGTYQPGTVGSNAVVGPFQAFMVHMTNAGTNGSYTINASDRVVTTHTFYSAQANKLNIVAANNETGLLDQTTIGFDAAATDTFDSQLDADKIPGALNRHTIYSVNNGSWMAINILNSIATTSTVPVGFEPGTTGTFTLTFNGLNSFDATSYIYLEDKTLGIMYNVRNGNYTFTADSADGWDRFVLHFTPAAQITAANATCAAEGTIDIEQPGTADWNYTLTDNSNAIITSGTLNQNQQVTVGVPAGSYTLTLIDTNNYTVVKAIQVNGPEMISAGFQASSENVQTGQNVTLTSTTANASSYQWNFGNGTSASGANTSVSYTQPGTYTVSLLVTNQSGCTATKTQTITVSANNTGIANVSGTNSPDIWSHDNTIFVDFTTQPEAVATVIIYDILGQQLSNEKITNNIVYQHVINNIEAAYMIVMVKEGDKITTKKVFIANTK